MKPNQVLVKTVDISKSFSGVTVLNKINVEIFEGEILGIIGENGAGKSTFIKILNGTYTPSEGQVFFDKNPVYIRDTSVAKRLGISTIPQEFNLINDLNVYENIFLGKELTKGKYLLDKQQMKEKTNELLQELDTDIPPDAKIQDLSVAQKQMVEIAKAVAYDSRLLIMDEPTTVLTQHEIDILFRLMQRLKEIGVTIIYISHKLREVKRICDRVMILRDGEFISLDPTDSLDEQEMARRMVGRELNQIFPPKTTPQATTVLQVHSLSIPGLLHDINFDLHKGEILGFSGLIGAGRTELAEALIGIRQISSGQIVINGTKQMISSPIDAVRNGIAYLSEDRQGTGVLTGFDVASNITLVSLDEYCKPLIDRRKEKHRTEDYIKAFNIRTPSTRTLLEYLSGGNQQKVSLAKSLDPHPEIFIIDEPTRGIDVNAKKEVYYFIHDLVKSGISCILISSEMEEILGLCNRVVVMREGRITGILEAGELSEAEIMFYATGLKEGA
ncbi:MAG: sugar ABC transporter ATP-binding protein [Firmicutes bacterium]|nr:sugar ABC transporter ATP-binding protein [Bacillota bacterium]